MNIQTEHLDNHTARLTVEVDPERVDKAMRQAARRISQRGRIPGFRPGKAPMDIILNLFGREYVLHEALETLGNEIYREALEEAAIDPYAPGSLEDINEETGLKLTFVVPKQPTVDLGDYRSIRAPYEAIDVTDEMVTEALEDLRMEEALIEPADRPARMGDQLTLSDVHVTLLSDDEAEESPAEPDEAAAEEPDAGESVAEQDEAAAEEPDEEDDDAESQVIFHEHNYKCMLREDKHDLLPGFSAQLVDLSAGEEKIFELAVPQDSEDKKLAGQTVNCAVTVETVQSCTLPEWTDELAERISKGEFKTILELRVDVRKKIEEAAKRLADQKIAQAALEQLVEGATFAYPEEVIQDYLSDMLEEMDRNLRQKGVSLEVYLRVSGKKEEDLRTEYREHAIKRLRRSLALGELVRSEGLRVSPDELEAEIDEMSQAFGGDQVEQIKKFLTTNESLWNISSRMVTDRAFDRLAAIAKGENPPVADVTPAPETTGDNNES